MSKLVLASSSPRRRELIKKIARSFECISPDYIEKSNPALSPREEALLFAKGKALSLVNQYAKHVIIGCDTLVAFNHQKIGKPQDASDAFEILSALSGKKHTVMTAVFIWYGSRQIEYELLEKTEVYFREISVSEIQAYIATGEPMDKAGAYGIQGEAAHFVEKISGDYDNVVGLPLQALKNALIKLSNLTGDLFDLHPNKRNVLNID